MNRSAAPGVRERPIIFDAESIGAILSGGKTQSRRVVSLPRSLAGRTAADIERCVPDPADPHVAVRGGGRVSSPYGRAGDRLWVKETHLIRTAREADAHLEASYREATPPEERGRVRWRTPLFMPRWAARLVLEVVAVRAERLQSLGSDDAVAEGMANRRTARADFAARWDGLNAKRGFPWLADPWVWVVTFRPASRD